MEFLFFSYKRLCTVTLGIWGTPILDIPHHDAMGPDIPPVNRHEMTATTENLSSRKPHIRAVKKIKTTRKNNVCVRKSTVGGNYYDLE